MPSNADLRPLRIAVSFGAIHPQLATLLARQRIEEPETPVALSEVAPAEQIAGLKDRRYELGFTLGVGAEHGLKMQPLWHDELAVLVPARSPLLVYPEIPLPVLADYPMVMWDPDACAVMHRHAVALLDAAAITPQIEAYAKSFSFMATLVAAGYGVGFAARSRIDAARGTGVVARPFAGDAEILTTYVLTVRSHASSEALRLIERALAIQALSGDYRASSSTIALCTSGGTLG